MGDKRIGATYKITNFVKQASNDSDKTVLYLKNNHLDAVPLSETKLYERVLAWFGFGPLSLRNISKFIQEYNLLADIPDEEKEQFSKRLIEKCEHFNQSHTVRKINNVFIDNLSQNHKLEFAEVFSSFTGVKSDEILDFAYSNATLGTAFVIDVERGNDTQELSEKNWDNALSSIKEDYEQSLKWQKFNSLKDASNWFKGQMQNFLINLPKDCDFSWVQKVEINGQFFLLACHKGAPTLFIKHTDGKVDRRTAIQKASIPTFSEEPISRLDVIIGISKGFGDYITENVMITELSNVDTKADQIFHNLIRKFSLNSKPLAVTSASGKQVTKTYTDNNDEEANPALFILR